MKKRTAQRLGFGFGGLVVAVGLVAWFWNWDWFIPIVQRTASSALGREVRLDHLHVRLGRVTRVTADGVSVANPVSFPLDSRFATADRLVIDANVWEYVLHRQVVLPMIALTKPVIDAERLPDGTATWSLGSSSTSTSSAPPPQIGDLRIDDGRVKFIDPKLRANMDLAVHTEAVKGDQDARIVVDGRGTYADQPVTAGFKGGALLSLRDASKPYPVDLRVANGPTKMSLRGTLTDPLAFKGANLKLELSGPDMALLFPLTGIPIPETPAYRIAGDLDYNDRKIKFSHFSGTVGRSDLNGEIDVDPTGDKPVVDANLVSHKVDLTDLGGFIGTTPGRAGSTPQSTEQKQELVRREKSARFLPDTPINMPKVEAANVHLRYKGERIEGRYVPLDNIVVALDIDDGRVQLHPLSFAVGKGEIKGTIDLKPQPRGQMQAVADVDFRKLDLSRLMAATHAFHGQGIVGGRLQLNTHGNSIATFLGNGDGGVKLFIQDGGDISALLTDLIGLQFGDAILSALGVPSRAELQCFVSDLPLEHGDLTTRVFLLDTSETRVLGGGSIDLKTEAINFQLKTQAKHFTVGSLPTPINIGGTLKDPAIRPEIGPLAARGGAAVALGLAFPPLALLPTIQFGIGEDGACASAFKTAESGPGPTVKPSSTGRR